jgi:hypothetical protein
MKIVARDGHWGFTTKNVPYKDSSGKVSRYLEGLEYDLQKVVSEHMNMTFFHVPTTQVLRWRNFLK